MREEGLAELTKDPSGGILEVRLAELGEREIAAQTLR